MRALYNQLCAAITHPAAVKGTVRCPANLGISYTGTFYAGGQALARFVYGATGCQTVSLTAAGQTKTTIMIGSAAAAAPKLQSDLAAVLGVPSLAMAQPKDGDPAGRRPGHRLGHRFSGGRLPDSSRSNSPSLTPRTNASHSASVK